MAGLAAALSRVHTPGGLVLAAGQIAHALKRHRGTVSVFVPRYARSGGTPSRQPKDP